MINKLLKIPRKIYSSLLEALALLRLSIVNQDIILVDFDFTLAMHKSAANKRWDLNESLVNKSLLNELKLDRFYIFTARGLKSIKEIRKWLALNDIPVKGILTVGSTSGKFRILRLFLFFSKKHIIWYDDLTDVSLDFSQRIEFDMDIKSSQLSFHRI